MKSQARVVVIGGGVVGCSVLYHLTRRGWTDVLLIERSELTSGSTWHAAGGFHTLNGDPNVAKLQAYTVSLYKEIEELSGQSCGLHLTGALQLADTPERLDWLKMAHARGRYLGMETEIISAKEAKELLPLIEAETAKLVAKLNEPVNDAQVAEELAYLPAPPCISLDLPVPPYISPHLARRWRRSWPISLHLPASR